MEDAIIHAAPEGAKWYREGLYYKIGLHGKLFYFSSGWKVSTLEERDFTVYNELKPNKPPKPRKKRVARKKGQTIGEIKAALEGKELTARDIKASIGRDVSRELARLKKKGDIIVVGYQRYGVRSKGAIYALPEVA